MFVVVLIILNPELAQLALFIDAIGLEMFLMLLEVQVVAMFGLFFNSKIAPIYLFAKRWFFKCFAIESWKAIVDKPESFLLGVASPAMLMNALVLTAAIGMLLNVR